MIRAITPYMLCSFIIDFFDMELNLTIWLVENITDVEEKGGVTMVKSQHDMWQ